MELIWQQHVEKAVKQSIQGSIFAGFNTNVDVVVHCNSDSIAGLFTDPDVTREQVNSLDADEISMVKTKNEFVTILKDALGKGKSFYIILEDLNLLNWLDRIFTTRQELMGGQAGIIANQMAALHAKSIVFTSLLSQKQSQMFFPEVLCPVYNEGLEIIPVERASRAEDNLKINWIFEYAKGQEFDFWGEKVITPRANRVILATRPDGVKMEFTDPVAQHLPELGAKLDVAFMAGYHYAPSTEPDLSAYLEQAMSSIRQLKSGNKDLRLHYEYVPMKDAAAERRVLTTVAKEFQSFGINENEIRRVLAGFGFSREVQELESKERAFALYKGCLRLFESLDFQRFHLHNLGYYVLVLRKPYPVDVKHVRMCCLYGSAVNAIKAKYGGYVAQDAVAEAAEFGLSDIGINQIQAFYQEAKSLDLPIPDNFCEEGIWERDDHYVLVVPAHVVPHPVSTVGMGDTISSSSYASEYVGVYVQR